MGQLLLGILFSFVLLGGSHGAIAAPLQDAAKQGDIHRVQQLINEGANLDARAGSGTALHWSILKGHDSVAALLIERGASVNITASAFGAPLHAAASKNNAAITLLLLEHGANPNVRRGDGFTPLHVAAEYADKKVIGILVEHGADPNVLSNQGQTPLHLAEFGNHPEAAEALRAAGIVLPALEPLEPLMASASAERGRDLMVVLRCAMCHSVERTDQQTKPGPNLWGVVGRPIASLPEYKYTAALKRLGGVWSEERLYAFITHPMAVAPGTKMDWDEIGEPQQRADIIAYLSALGAGQP